MISKETGQYYYQLWQKQAEIIKIVLVYRYLSLIITSLFFFFTDIQESVINKIFIIICLFIASNGISYLYLKKQGNIKALVTIEIIGNTIILIPTGGLSSPFVWYALNTLLLASIELDRKYSWINLGIYLVAATWVSSLVASSSPMFFEETNLLLSLILITIGFQLLTKYVQQLNKNSQTLVQTNEKLKETMNYLMEIFQSVHIFSATNNQESLINSLVQYVQKITKGKRVLFFKINPGGENKLVILPEDISKDYLDKITAKLKALAQENRDCLEPVEIFMGDKAFLIVPVKSEYITYGFLGVKIDKIEDSDQQTFLIEQLKFLAELSSIILERFQLEQINQHLLVYEEQNRIANEIHDSALQRLFSVSCGLYSLRENIATRDKKEVQAEINIIRSAINNTMHELRKSIYGLSWDNSGKKIFEQDILDYINQVKSLNQVEIKLNILGQTQLLDSIQKKALYRIICEGTSNAIRHGEPKEITIGLNVNNQTIALEIADNGKGFSPATTQSNQGQGLGIKNITSLVTSLNGKLTITSKRNQGSRIKVLIPTNKNNLEEEVV